MFERRPGNIVFPSPSASPTHRFLILKSLLARKKNLKPDDPAGHWVSRRVTEIFESLKVQDRDRIII